tara:strand:- start:107 stop:637 length:531 start_codon:yes stop_codon:yes gene_type:complete
MKKIFHLSIVLLFVFTIFSIPTTFALSPTPPLPICFVKGTITEVEYRDADCVGEIGQQICHTDEYLLSINIEEVTLVEQREYDYSSCEEAYTVGSQQKISLPKEVANEDDVFESGLNIEGEVSKPLFAKKFDSYTLEKSQEPTESTQNNFSLLIALGVAVVIIIALLMYIIFGKKK